MNYLQIPSSRGLRRQVMRHLCLVLTAAMALIPQLVSANAWVVGNVSIVEDYRAYDPQQGILITLVNKTYYGDTSPSSCTERFRVVVGEENVTAESQKVFLALLLAARLTGDRVRLFVNPSNDLGLRYCAVQIASVGDV